MPAALNISKAIRFQEGIFDAIMLKIFPLEVTGDILGAFQLAVFLKTLDFKVNNSHMMSMQKVMWKIEIAQSKETTMIVAWGYILIRSSFLIKMALFLSSVVTVSQIVNIVYVDKQDNNHDLSLTSTRRLAVLLVFWYLSFLGLGMR